MKMMKMGWVGLALALGACTSGTAATGGSALSASEAAHRYGVDRYVVLSNDTVSLLGADGTMLGVLTVTAPTPASREVQIEYPNAQPYIDLVTNKATAPAGIFLAPLPLDSREAAVQLDPALAPLFAAHGITFSTPPEGPAQLNPSLVADCDGLVPWASSCNLCGENSSWPCEYYSWGVIGTALCSDSRQGCPNGDLVQKQRTCTDTTCTNQSLGFLGCSSTSDTTSC